MNKVSKIVVFVVSAIFIVMAVAVGMKVIEPKLKEQNRIAEEERIKAEIEQSLIEKEEHRKELLDNDAINFETMEYQGVMLGMTGISGWSVDIPKFYLGIDVLKGEAVINTSEEFMTLWNAALASDNQLVYACFILDPVKMYSDAGECELNLNLVIGNNPDIQFRVFMPNYSKDYWYDISDGEFESIISYYDSVMRELISFENVTLACYTGEDWIIENNGVFEDKETGDLNSVLADKLFLYTYMDNWVVNSDNLNSKLEMMQKNCRISNGETEQENAFSDDSEYDIVFIGDSIFALSDGPYSIASIIGEMTGARIYNCSKGGIGAVSEEEEYSMLGAIDHFIAGEATGFEEWDVFDTNVTAYAQKGHRDRKTVFILNCCINDYIAGSELSDYAEAYEECYSKLLDKYPDAKIVFVAPYYIQYGENGTLQNERGLTMGDYSEMAREISENYGVYYLDLCDSGKFNEGSAATILEDGTHPTPAGCKEVANILNSYLEKIIGE